MNNLTPEEEYKERWNNLDSGAREVLRCLCRHGPALETVLPNWGKGDLLAIGLAVHIVMADNKAGYLAATVAGGNVYKYGYEDK